MKCSDAGEDWEATGAQEYDALLVAVFGESDTDEDSEDQHCTDERVDSHEEYLWEKVEEVEGLWHCSNFLSIEQQQSLLEAIDSDLPQDWEFVERQNMFRKSDKYGCKSLSYRARVGTLTSNLVRLKAMRFGDLPGWAKDLSTLIERSVAERLQLENSDQYSEIDEFRDSKSPLPSRILNREPLFDQMIVNMYQPGEGISAHVDLLRFEDGIAIVSLESACVMSFRPVNTLLNGVEDTCAKEPILVPHLDSNPGYGNFANTKDMPPSRPLSCKQLEASRTIPQTRRQSDICELDSSIGAANRVDVMLNPGNLITAYGPARYDWTHEINRGKGNQLWKGQPIVQQRRVSVTLRRLCLQEDAS